MKKIKKNCEICGEMEKKMVKCEHFKEPRVKKPKYRSRATRCADCCSTLQDIAQELKDLDTEVSEERTKEVIIEEAQEILNRLDYSELEILKEEIESWRDNMSGTALENTEKYQTLDECVSTLDDVISTLEGVGEISSIDDIENAADEIESGADSAEGAEFPGMFG